MFPFNEHWPNDPDLRAQMVAMSNEIGWQWGRLCELNQYYAFVA